MKLQTVIQFLVVRAFEAIVAIALVIIMPNVPPDAKFSKSYSVAPSMPLENKLALNERLNQVEIWHKGEFVGPEAFAEYNGELYTSIHGDVVKLTGNHITPVVKFGKPCKGLYQEQICGRPLGLTFDKNGALYVADAYYGLFKVDIKTGKKLQLVSVDQEIDGKKPKVPNSVTVASNGDLYWTDSSTEFILQDGVFDMLADGSGRLIHYDAKTKKNTVLIDDLHFANGVVLSKDESFLLVSETARSCVHRYYLKGPKKGANDVFIDGLPGLPDNLHSDGQDGFLIPLVVAKDTLHPSPFQIFGPFPIARKFFARVLGLTELGFRVLDQIYPNTFAERGMHLVGHFTSLNFVMPSRVTVLHVSKTGEVLDSLHALNKKISGISEAFIFKDYLYLGSPFNDYIARIPLAKAGLKHLALSKEAKASSESKSATTQTPPKQTQAPPTTTQAPPKQTPTTTQAPPKPTPITTRAPPKQTPTTTQAPPTTTQAPPKQTSTTTQAPPKPTPTTTRAPPKQTSTTTQAPPVTTTTPPPTTKTPPSTTRTPTTQSSTTKSSPSSTKTTSPPSKASTTTSTAGSAKPVPTQAPSTVPTQQSRTVESKPSTTTSPPPRKQPDTATTPPPTKEPVKQSHSTETKKQPKDSSTKEIPKSGK